jgi:hypothetical protein
MSSLLSTPTPGRLLRLVWLQDRGVCKFVGLLKTWLIQGGPDITCQKKSSNR